MADNKKLKVMMDDFRVSHIFDIEEPIAERSLQASLSAKGFRVINDRVISHPPLRAVILSLASKNNVNVIYQKEAIPSYIGTAGRDMKEVLKQFDILNSILTDIDPTLHGRHTSTEMVMTVKVWGEELPDDTIPKLGASDISKFDSLFGREMRTRLITLENRDEQSDSYYSLTLAPLNRSPRYYYVQLVNRDKDLTNVLKFTDRGEEIIKNAVALVEQGS